MNTTYDFENDNLINIFTGSEKIKKNYSQAYQDLFVLTMLSGKSNGKYLEIGSNHPIDLSNTYLLETQFGWKGISVDIDNDLVELFNNTRKNKCYSADATQFDFLQALNNRRWKTKTIDYLSLDCEPASITYQSLLKIPFDDYKFSVITYETDVYQDNPKFQELSREYLKNKGYQLVASNVCNGSNPYEDWYVDPSTVSENIWKPFISDGIEARNLFITNN